MYERGSENSRLGRKRLFLFSFLRGKGGERVSRSFVPDCNVERLCCRVGGEVKHLTSNESIGVNFSPRRNNEAYVSSVGPSS